MTSKERITRALKRQETDKVPVDLGGSVQSTIHAYAYDRLKKALGIKTGRVQIMDTFILAALVEDSVREALQIDTVPIRCPVDACGVRNDAGEKAWAMPNGLQVIVSDDFNPVKAADGSWLLERGGTVFRLPPEGYYFDPINYALENAKTPGDVDRLFDFSGYGRREAAFLCRQAEQLRGTDKFVIGDVFASFSAEDVFGYEKAFANLIENKELTIYFIERLTDMFIHNFDVFYSAVGDVADMMMIHKDMGNQRGPMISPRLAEEIFFPAFTRFIAHVKSKSKYFVMMHNCGSIYAFLPGLIRCGIDAINPLQFTAKDMELEKLKREFGKDLCFWGGGVDTQHVLPFGTADEVRRQVRDNAAVLGRNGGYVFTPVHCIQAGVPAENMLAAFEESGLREPAARQRSTPPRREDP